MDKSDGKTLDARDGEYRAATGTFVSGDSQRPDARRLSRRRNARREYGLARRLELLDESFEKARSLLPNITRPHELQQFVLAVAILIDRRRPEEGRVTDRPEVWVSWPGDPLARLTAHLFLRPRKGTSPSKSH